MAAIEAFLRREVLPYADPMPGTHPTSVKTGYEINFNRHFYKLTANAVAGREIATDILALNEHESSGLQFIQGNLSL